MSRAELEHEQIRSDIEGYLARHQQKELLRFVTVGSVDDGKSTLIGRLLYDTHGIYEDQLSAVARASSQKGSEIDLSLFTDGLRAEREQGITIDVAYRYFSTEKRKFIIADTPGHVQYTRNMATGASTASVAIILIDARLGVQPQSRRHATIASLLGIPHLAVCVNKMDLCGWQRDVFDAIHSEFGAFATRLGFRDVRFFPISAKLGDNVVRVSETMPFGQGTLLEYLESVPVTTDRELASFRYPVQYVLRPNLGYRGFAGQIASGVVRRGDPVLALPSRRQSTVAAIDVWEGALDEAFSPMSVSLRLADEIDVSRGDMLVHPDDVPRVSQRFHATLVWMNERRLNPDRTYLVKHTTQLVRAQIERVGWKLDLERLEQTPAETLELNDIGRVTLRCHRPIFWDPYAKNRATGAFIVIDSLTNNTVAAGMLTEDEPEPAGADRAAPARSQVSAEERRDRLGHPGAVVLLCAPDPAAATRLAWSLERRLFDQGIVATAVADPAGVPVGELGLRLADAGVVAILVAPATREARLAVKQRVGAERCLEVAVELAALTGPTFEPPERPLASVAAGADPERAAELIAARLLELIA